MFSVVHSSLFSAPNLNSKLLNISLQNYFIDFAILIFYNIIFFLKLDLNQAFVSDITYQHKDLPLSLGMWYVLSWTYFH